jgi:hypothetical protein
MSVQRQYSLPAPAIANVPVTGGNGSNSTTNIAKAFLDMRTSSVFNLDISGLTRDGNLVYIQFDTVAGSVGAFAGKVITILFTGIPDVSCVIIYLTTNFGPNVSSISQLGNLYTYGSFGQALSIKLMSDGTDFVVTSMVLQ